MNTPDQLNKYVNLELLPAFEEKIHVELTAFLTGSITRLDAINKAFTKNEVEKGIRLAQELPHILKNQPPDFFCDTINQLTAHLDELVLVPQEAYHYDALDGDTGYIKTIKKAKKTGRAISTFFFGLQYLRKDEKPLLPYRKRTIPVKNVAQYILLKRTKVWDQFLTTRNSVVYNCIQFINNQHISQLLGESEGAESVLKVIEQTKTSLIDLYAMLEISLKNETIEAKNSWDRILPRVGTFEHTHSKYDTDDIDRLRTIVLKNSVHIDNHWSPLIAEQARQLQVVYTLLQLKISIAKQGLALASEYQRFITECVLEPHKLIYQELDTWLQKLSQFEKKDVDKAFAVSRKNKKLLQEHLSSGIIEPVQQVVEQATFSNALNNFTAEVALLAEAHDERINLITVEGFDDNLPEYEFREINWQTFLRRMLGDIIASVMVPDLIKPETHLQQLVDDYAQLLQVVETNLDVAAEVDSKDDLDSQEVLAKGIALSIKKMDDIQTKIDVLESVVVTPLASSQLVFFERLYDLMINQDVGELKWVDTQLKVKESAGNYSQRLLVLWAQIVDKLDLSVRFLISKVRQINSNVRSLLGYSAAEHISVQKANIARLLHETEITYKKLPFIYNRLFNFRREVESTFFIKNATYFMSVSNALELWNTGFPASISVIGEKGSGKTTFIKHLASDIFKKEQVEQIDFTSTLCTQAELLAILGPHFKVENPSSIQDIISKISRRRKRTVIVVENIQNCFVRHINGYEAINAMLYLISETREKVLWVVSGSRYAWNFLHVVSKISDYFSHSIAVDGYSENDIRDMILRRQKASGYQVVFRPDASTAKSRAYRKTLGNATEEQAFLEERFFEQLWRLAEGNSTAAMIYWIRSIVRFEESQFFIEPQSLSGIEYLQELDSNSLFILAAFVLHDSLKASELALVMRISETDAHMQISRLHAQGLLVDKGVNYSLNDMIFRQVVRLLKSRNILNS